MTEDEYLNLITSEHRDQPNFTATVRSSVAPFASLQAVLSTLPTYYDLDNAIGVQLDAVGAWVGISRRISTPLVGIYFSWDGTAAEGWDAGIWKGPYDPDSGLVDLPDDAYRRLIKAKIAANSWDGTIPSAYAIWDELFPNSYLVMQDNQDMSMVIGIAGQPLSSVDQALLTNGYIPLKPAGVRVKFYAVAQEDGPLFAWDVEAGSALAGWDIGKWAIELSPPQPEIVEPILVDGFLVTVNGEGVRL